MKILVDKFRSHLYNIKYRDTEKLREEVWQMSIFKKKKTSQQSIETTFQQLDNLTESLLKRNEKKLKNLLTNGTDAFIIDNR